MFKIFITNLCLLISSLASHGMQEENNMQGEAKYIPSNGQHLKPKHIFEKSYEQKSYGEKYLQGELNEDEVKKIHGKSEELIQYFISRCFNGKNGIDASMNLRLNQLTNFVDFKLTKEKQIQFEIKNPEALGEVLQVMYDEITSRPQEDH